MQPGNAGAGKQRYTDGSGCHRRDLSGQEIRALFSGTNVTGYQELHEYTFQSHYEPEGRFHSDQVTMSLGSVSSRAPLSSPLMHSPSRWLQSDFVSTSAITRLRFQSLPDTQKVNVLSFTSRA